MIQATAQGQSNLPDGTPVNTPVDLQLAFLMDRWTVAIMGPEPTLTQIIKADRALAIYRAFRKSVKDRTDDDWQMITSTLRIIEDWQ